MCLCLSNKKISNGLTVINFEVILKGKKKLWRKYLQYVKEHVLYLWYLEIEDCNKSAAVPVPTSNPAPCEDWKGNEEPPESLSTYE